MSEIGMELLERYLAGKTSPEESERVNAWLAEDPRRWAELTDVRDALERRDLSDPAVEQALREVWARLAPEVGQGGEPPAVGAGSGRPRREFALADRWRKSLLPLAAALVLLMVGGGLVAMLLLRRSQPVQAMRVATTAPAERASFRLGDGTRVILGVASVLRYPHTFPANSREVQLEGEAYFDVSHEERRPFVVRAGDLVATDLGTQFTVRAYPDDPMPRVVVREGRVAVRPRSPSGRQQVLDPGELGRLVEGVVTVEPADTAAFFGWTEGRLVFEDTPLREALPHLGRWFDLEFRLADSAMGNIPLTVTLRAAPTAEVLANLAASLGMRSEQHGRTVILRAADTSP